MRICSVIGCGNGTYQLEKWKQGYCPIHGCHFGAGQCICQPPFQLFTFPSLKSKPEQRRRWVKVINRKDPKLDKNWEPKAHDRICSKHFVDGQSTKENPDPTLHLGYSSERPTTPRRPPTERTLTPASKRKRTQEHTAVEEPRKSTSSENITHDHSYTYSCDCQPGCRCPGCAKKEAKIKLLQQRVKELEEKLVATKLGEKKRANGRRQPFDEAQLCKDKDIQHCTGLISRDFLNSLFNYLEPHAVKMKYWKSSKKGSVKGKVRHFRKTPTKSGPKRALSLKNELVLVLMRLRLDLPVQFLSILFGIRPSTSSQIITTWVKFLSFILKPLIVWPDKGAIKSTLPKSFKAAANKTRCIIDCTEIFIERPRSLYLQAVTWSDYKKHNTMKVLVGITPTGTISFLSDAYGGRASDVFITRDSGFLNLLDPGDVIMADRGFPIQEDLMLRHATLEIPPAAKGNRQMTHKDVKKTKKVANLRIHVERAINRLKTFKILNGVLPLTLLSYADDILIVCAALSNLQPDLVS